MVMGNRLLNGSKFQEHISALGFKIGKAKKIGLDQAATLMFADASQKVDPAEIQPTSRFGMICQMKTYFERLYIPQLRSLVERYYHENK